MDGPNETERSGSVDRRKVLGVAAAAAAGAWVAPVVLSSPAYAQATAGQPAASLFGIVTDCGNALGQGESATVYATLQGSGPGGAQVATTTTPPGDGSYTLNLPGPGTYDLYVVLHIPGSPGFDIGPFGGGTAVAAGGALLFDIDITAC